jgi:hypothetical protein
VARIDVADAQAYVEKSKLTFNTLDAGLIAMVEPIVLGQLNRAYDVSTIQNFWVNSATTPPLVRVLIALKYVSLYYDRAYSEDDGSNTWARRLDRMYNDLIDSISTGDIDIPEIVGVVGVARSPRFYPNDASTAESGPTTEDPAAGPNKFSMGMVF